MRIQYFSDVHFEFHKDAGHAFTASLDPTDVDVLVIAGDLAVGLGIGAALDTLCERFQRSTVVYVHGNHEFYGTTRDDVIEITRAALSRHPNLRWLDGHATDVKGTRFLGVPLWFRQSSTADTWRFQMNDFHQIEGFQGWVYEENARALAFFERELREGDIVVTHHLPAQACVAPKWKDHPLNPFFVCDVEDLLRARKPALWIHGHTHETIDVRIGATRVVCNPFGYVRIEENRAFDFAATVEL